MYLSIREYAAQRLVGAARDGAEHRHKSYYLERGLQWAARAEGPTGASARQNLEAEQSNLVLVLRRAEAGAERSRADDALTVALALQPVLMVRGPAALRRSVIASALSLAGDGAAVDQRRLGWVRLAGGDTALGIGDMAGARELFDRALEDADAVGDLRLRGRTLWRIGTYHWTRDDFDDARVAFEAALAVHQKVGDVIHVGRCHTGLGIVALDRGALDEAADQFERALEHLEVARDDRWIGRTIGHLGALEDARGNLDEARQLYLSALEMHERLSNRRHLAPLLAALGALELELGHSERARGYLDRARAAERAVVNVRTAAMIDLHMGRTEEYEGDREAAKRSFRAASRPLAQIESRRLRADGCLERARLDADTKRHLDEARVLVGEGDAFLTALLTIVEGHQLVATDPAAARLCLARVEPVAAHHARVRRAARGLRAVLSDGLPDEALVIGAGWFKAPNGVRVDISHRRAPAALLAALAEARTEGLHRTLSIDALFEVGWPGERALPEALKSRVYVAISTLRKLGLEHVLVRDDTGYRLDPNTPLLRGGDTF